MTGMEFSPLVGFEQTARRWWLILLLMILGGGFGWLYRRIQPPLYEAKAILVVNVDFTETGLMSELEEDQSILTVQTMIISTPVAQQVWDDLQRKGISTEAFMIGQNAFQERRQSQLVLTVRNTNAQAAADIANIWAERAFAALKDAHDHAVYGHILWKYLMSMEYCLAAPPVEPIPPSICNHGSLEDITKNIQVVQNMMAPELQASNGIIPALSIAFSQRASLPVSPVEYQQNLLVIAGALIGLILGVFLSALRKLPFTKDR
jgi:hypothetical protein